MSAQIGYAERFYFSGANYRDQRPAMWRKSDCIVEPANDRIAEKIADAYRGIEKRRVRKFTALSLWYTMITIDR